MNNEDYINIKLNKGGLILLFVVALLALLAGLASPRVAAGGADREIARAVIRHELEFIGLRKQSADLLGSRSIPVFISEKENKISVKYSCWFDSDKGIATSLAAKQRVFEDDWKKEGKTGHQCSAAIFSRELAVVEALAREAQISFDAKRDTSISVSLSFLRQDAVSERVNGEAKLDGTIVWDKPFTLDIGKIMNQGKEK